MNNFYNLLPDCVIGEEKMLVRLYVPSRTVQSVNTSKNLKVKSYYSSTGYGVKKKSFYWPQF